VRGGGEGGRPRVFCRPPRYAGTSRGISEGASATSSPNIHARHNLFRCLVAPVSVALGSLEYPHALLAPALPLAVVCYMPMFHVPGGVGALPVRPAPPLARMLPECHRRGEIERHACYGVESATA